jgi:spermidine synthase
LFILLLLCFFLSGFAALVYETAWAREFEFVFGTSELAVVSVLAAYMAGLAAGSAVAGRLVHRVRRPVLWYGLLELGIAASALAVPWGIRGATWLQAQAMGGRPAPPAADEVSAALFYVVAAFAVLLVPTGLMGATLPLLARHAVRRDEELGRRVGILYATNTLGAVAGTVTTAFLLLPSLGLRSTVTVGVATNALVFVAAALLARSAGTELPPAGDRRARPPAFHWVLPAVAISGAVSFTYEVLWTRLIGQMVGGTIQGFATMLGSFLLGIAIGSAVAARFAREPARAARGFAVAQLGTASLSLLAFMGLEYVPAFANTLGAGHVGSLAGNALIAALVLLPGSLCIGAVFPFAVRLLARDETEAGPASARVYVWNTLGSITGALASGFLLLPALRFDGTIVLAAGANLVLALAVATRAQPVAKAVAGLAAAGLALLVFVRPDTPWSVLRHSAMLQSATPWNGEVRYYGVGRSSTVLLLDQRGGFRLTTNGLPESFIRRNDLGPPDAEPAAWLGMLPALLRPGLRNMLVIGFGGGITVDAVPSSVQEITVIELEDEVLRAHAWLATQIESSPLHDPRVRLVLNDARGALQLTDARFGAIVSQPSHPWTAGASHLYTREFFSLARRHLEPGGVLVQWIGLAFVDEAILRSMVATLLDVFPHVSIFAPTQGAVLFAASDSPIDPVATAARALSEAPADLARHGLQVPEDVVAAWGLATGDARDFAGTSPLITDDENPLATHSARIGTNAVSQKRVSLFSDYEPLSVAGDGLDPVYLVSRIAMIGARERALRLAQSVEDPTTRLTALGWVKIGDARSTSVATFRKALATDPTASSARFGLLSMIRRRVEEGDPEALELAAPLEGAAAAVVAGWRLAALGEWEELRALDPILATASPRDLARMDAQRLRTRWRTASSDPALRAEAAELADEVLQSSQSTPDLILAAAALAAANQPNEALALIDKASRRRRGPKVQRAALAVLESVRPDVDAEEWESVRLGLTRQARRRESAGGGS